MEQQKNRKNYILTELPKLFFTSHYHVLFEQITLNCIFTHCIVGIYLIEPYTKILYRVISV